MSEKARAKYKAIRAALIERGTTLRQFALAHGYNIQTVYCAAKQTRAGVKSTRILKHLTTYAAKPIDAVNH